MLKIINFLWSQYGGLGLKLGFYKKRGGGGGGGNPASEALTDESLNALTDESGNTLFSSGA